MIYELRPYQIDSKKHIRDYFNKGINKIILCMPTGAGKTVTFANMAREAVMNGFVVGIVVDRKELLDQAKDKLISYGLNPSIITAGKSVKIGSASYVATVQTLVRREIPKVGLWIIDEAHKQIFDKLMGMRQFKDAYVIGATATPYRTGRMNQLSNMYGEMVESVSISDLITDGYLSPAITYGVKMDTSKMSVKRGDYDNSDLYKAFDKPTLYAGVVDKYMKFANGTKAICFNVNVEHSKKVTDTFNAAGIPSMHVDGTTPVNERNRILSHFRRSKGPFVLNNVEVLTTGFDEWTIETVIINLATRSLPKWLQMCGRGSRITPSELSGKQGILQKDYYNIIDMGGNVFRLGFWEEKRTYNLTHKTKDTIEAAPVKSCPDDKIDFPNLDLMISRRSRGIPDKILGCGAIVHASASTCKFCGYVFEIKKEAPKEAEFIQIENYDSLPKELIGKSWGSMSISELEIVRKSKGYKQGWLIRQILLSKDLKLIDYAFFKKYKNPYNWAAITKKRYTSV